MDKSNKFIPYSHPLPFVQDQSLRNVEQYFGIMESRRSLRQFSKQPIDQRIIEKIIQVASTSPSGAHKQPWMFCAVQDISLKKQIREAAEKEEYENYHGRMSEAWLKDLEPFDTDWQKPFLEEAPWLIVVFKKVYDITDGDRRKNYYVNESVGIACGMLLSAIHQAGLVALTHTPSPMNFLESLLKRPSNERAFLLIPVGRPAKDAIVPNLSRKSFEEICKIY